MNTIGRVQCPDLEGNAVVMGIYNFFMRAVERTDEIYARQGTLTITDLGKKEVLSDMEVYMSTLIKAGKLKHAPVYRIQEIKEHGSVCGIMLSIDPNDIRKALGLPKQTSVYIQPKYHIVH